MRVVTEIAVALGVGEALVRVALEVGRRRRLEGLQVEVRHGERCHCVVEAESFLRLAEVILAVLGCVEVASSVRTKHLTCMHRKCFALFERKQVENSQRFILDKGR